MDPNHWNTYNIQYGHAATGTIPSAHPSLARIDLASAGIGLSHTLQTSHGSLGGRTVSAIPAVSYPALGMPILDPLSAGISASQTHKTMSLTPQLVFEPQVRGSDQQASSIGRYDSSKGFRADTMSRDSMMRNQLLEAAAARVLSSSNFASSNMYNQFGSVLSDVTATTMSPTAGSSAGSLTVSKSNQSQMHEPPPAHSSARLNSIQRNLHTSELLYTRGTEALIPTSLTQISSLYSSAPLGKQVLGSNQQISHNRQTPIHIQQGFTSSSDIEDLSSNSQNQLYSSYASLGVAESQDFSSQQLSGDINYEAVSPAPPMNESSQNNQEHPTFSIVHFPDLVNVTTEHAHALADKFQENDFRLKIDSRLQQESLATPHQSQRQEVLTALKLPKNATNFHSSLLTIQGNQRAGQFYTGMTVSPSLSQINSPAVNISQSSSLSQSSLATMAISMQQTTAPISVQAPADSTTKPKRSRNRKKKGDANVSTVASQAEDSKKSSSTEVFTSTVQQQTQLSQQTPILNMPLTSQHITTLPMGSHVTHNNSAQQQQNFRNLNTNQFTSRDAQRAQTPSIPQSYSIQDQSHSYAQEPSPKISHQDVIRPQSEFALPSNVLNEKSSNPASCKQLKKSVQSASKSNGNQLFRNNIPDNQQHIQTYTSHSVLMGNTGQQRGSPLQDSRSGGLGRMQNYENPAQQKMSCQMSPLGQPSPQNNIGTESSGFGSSKISNSSHMMGTGLIGSQTPVSHSSMDSRPVSVEPAVISHAYEQSHQSGLIDAHESGHFHIDFTGQPFLEQLVGVQPPMALPPSSYSHASVENGEVVFTTLVTPAENARLQQQHDSTNRDNFRPTYHGEPVHEIQPIGQLGSHLGIEDVSFNTFFDSQRDIEQVNMSVAHQGTPEPERMILTFVPHVVEDDELCHFNQVTSAIPMITKEPHDPGTKPPLKDSFQGSFLNYLQGHKQETLSSVSSSAVTKKPQLPKYIPEPRRTKPVATVSSTKDSLHFSDVEDNLGTATNKVKDLISSLSDNDNSSQKSESDREGYSVQRTSELAVRITLPKSKKNKFGPFAEMTHLKDRGKEKDKDGQSKRKRKRGKQSVSEADDYGQKFEEDISTKQNPLPKEQTPPPKRTSIGRKAKDKCIEKTKKSELNSGSDSSSEDESLKVGKGKVVYNSDGSERDYDSDKDPVWMPFEMDLKPGHDFDEKRKKLRRPRTRGPSTKSGKSSGNQKVSLSGPHSSSSNSFAVNVPRPSTTASANDNTTAASISTEETLFKTGSYVIEKKDMQNYEHYPIWRLEPGNMMRRFEKAGVSEAGVMRHQAVGIISAWMPSMENQFVLVKVQEIPGKIKGENLTVEVLEESRPKAPIDGRLVLQYEDDPLVEQFNIYLQVFLSQALQPTFLSAILSTNEKFYVDVLNQIDSMIEEKCREITKLAQWKMSFQEYLHMCPVMKEIDRPNLKQACQASENSSPPTIKSVLLSGQAYDRFLLTEKPASSSQVTQEFMIGKVAAYYVRPYHSLYHFKYWLHQRCDAKVKMMKESNKSDNFSDEVILDKCLENRSWVLQLFDSLKSLLKYGGDATR